MPKSVRPSRPGPAAALALALLLPGTAFAQEATPARQCWSADQLALKPGERTPRKATAAERVTPPASAAAGTPVTGALAGVVRRVELPAGVRLVALTFDLCETPGQIAGYDGPIFDTLRREGAAATFFAGGKWLATHPARAAQIAADPRFEIAGHSWDHANMHDATPAQVDQEVLTTRAGITAARASAVAQCPAARPVERLNLFRFPFGSCSAGSLAAANAAGEVVIQWDVVSGDPANIPAAAIVDNVMRQVRPGSIIVMHGNGNGKHTREALPAIIARLKAAGYGFATVSELLAAGRPVTVSSCYIDRPGDTARYDEAARRRAAEKAAARAAAPAAPATPAAPAGAAPVTR
ncbi:polysaccharide deacetylase family protein [Pseudoxanthobacter sp.]|uniref:polysaccharide deacetylase family protein n=1 Tax=Pseudoxanthobacter sp. TaxID=1925742 RepID=UPI002FE0FB16